MLFNEEREATLIEIWKYYVINFQNDLVSFITQVFKGFRETVFKLRNLN